MIVLYLDCIQTAVLPGWRQSKFLFLDPKAVCWLLPGGAVWPGGGFTNKIFLSSYASGPLFYPLKAGGSVGASNIHRMSICDLSLVSISSPASNEQQLCVNSLSHLIFALASNVLVTSTSPAFSYLCSLTPSFLLYPQVPSISNLWSNIGIPLGQLWGSLFF